MPANPEYIVVASADMRWLIDTVERLERKIDLVQITPRPEWVTVAEAARMRECCTQTITRGIKAGEIVVKYVGKKRMVRV